VYDPRNRLTETADGAADATTYVLDPYGDQTLTIDPRNFKTTRRTTSAAGGRGWTSRRGGPPGTGWTRRATPPR
jgi:hypothetical protein